MACGADGDSLRDAVLDAAELADRNGGDGPGNSRDDDGDDGHRGNAANLFGDDGTHGDGYGLGQEREHERAAQPE